MTIKIVKDQYGNVYAKGSTFVGNFLITIGVLCFIFGAIAIISGVLLGTVSAIIGTIFIYGGSHYTNKARKKTLNQYQSGEGYSNGRIRFEKIDRDREEDKTNLDEELENARLDLERDQKRLEELEEQKRRKNKLDNYEFDPFGHKRENKK